jgi:transposase InsO family protein
VGCWTTSSGFTPTIANDMGRIHAELRAEGQTVSRKRIERVMRRHGIRARAPRRYRVCTTDSKHSLPVALTHLIHDGGGFEVADIA